MLVTLCDHHALGYHEPAQQRSLNLRYQMGCECKITMVSPKPPRSCQRPAEASGPTAQRIKFFGQQAKYLSCIKRADGPAPGPRHGPA
ncbi:hypothetical protein AAFF_G00438830 [Aldrovandia affinis]|uniref:Uncharacterized protein n=1 Tax=Aldrovandia affinis TaxID=143900 RepID=A0AAD7R507_9TELE|nr:hypothetical protein AAFF_G00438830 [Aldrovandia affinis]